MVEKYSQIPELPYQEDFISCPEVEGYELEKLSDAFFALLRSKEKNSKYGDGFFPEDIKRIKVAFRLARDLHDGVFREEDGGRLPYLIHPLEVAYEVLKCGGSSAEVIAALLHDVREDIDDLKNSDDALVAEVFQDREVELITRLLSKFRYRNNELIELGKDEYYKKVFESESAVFIKMIDRLCNLRSFGRMLDGLDNKSDNQAKEILARVKKNIHVTRKYLLNSSDKKGYAMVKEELEMLVNKLETRLQIMETWWGVEKQPFYQPLEFTHWQGDSTTAESI
jgi:(p)ppGpp synthase/HD superfamily hydrolase